MKKKPMTSKGIQKTKDLKDDISLFIYELNILFNELKDLNSSLTEEEKFNYLYTSISWELAIETNIVLYNER